MSTLPHDAFPDLHQKMSKKIAQLTKVIYHLNTRNEDHQSELDAIAHSHQLETQQLARDAANKIGKFKDLMDIRKIAEAQELQMEKLLKKHELEKQTAIQDFESYKIKATDMAQRISRDYRGKFESQELAINDMNTRYQEKITNFEACSDELNLRLENSRTSSTLSIDKMKLDHKVKMEEIMRTNDENAKKMLQEHLNTLEAAKLEHEKSMHAAISGAEDRMRAEAAQALGLVRAQLAGDKQEALMTQRREYEEIAQTTKDDFLSKLEKLRVELKSEISSHENTALEKKRLSDELSARLRDMESQMGVQSGGQLLEVNSLKAQCASAEERVRSLTAQVEERDESSLRLQNMIREKNDVINSLEKVRASLEADLLAIRAELDSSQQSSTSAEKILRDRAAAGERESNGLRAEVNQMASTLALIRDELKSQEKNEKKKSAEFTSAIVVLKDEKEVLLRQLEELKASMTSSGSKASIELSSIVSKMELREAEMKREMKEREEAQKSALERFKDRHASEMQTERVMFENANAVAAQTHAHLQAKLISLQSDNDERVRVLLESHKQEGEESLSRHKSEIGDLQSAVSALTQQMAEASSQTDGERGALKTEMTRLELKYVSLQKDLESRKKEGERAEGVASSLKNQVESLREELKATQKAYQDKMDLSHAAIEKEWEIKMGKLRDTHLTDLENAAIGFKKNHGIEVQGLCSKHEGELRDMQNALQRVTSDASADSQQVGLELSKTLALLKEEKALRGNDVAHLNHRISEEREAAQLRLSSELEALRLSLEAISEEKERLVHEGNDTVMGLMKEMYKKAQDDHKSTLAENEATYSFNVQEALREERSKSDDVLTDVTKKLKRAHADALQELHVEREEAMRVSEDEKGALSRLVMDLKGTVQLGVSQLEAEKNSRALKEQEQRDREIALKKESEISIEREKKNGEKNLTLAMERAYLSEADLKVVFKEACAQYDSQLDSAKNAFDTLDARWKKRESRPEDVVRINYLENEVAEKEELVIKTREEMMYFKREMLNREENFNQKFGRSPVVGVMQVVKAKEPGLVGSSSDANIKTSKQSVGGFGGSKSSKPMYSVGAAGGAMNMGMGMAMTSGMGSVSLNATGAGAGVGSMKGNRDDPSRRLSS